LAAEALEAARRSLDGWQHVGLDEALVTQLPILRAKAQFLVGASLRDLGRPAEAFAAFEAAAGAYTSLVATRNEESLLRDQAASRHCAADALEELGRVESAADSFQVAADLRDCICERFPRKAAHRSDAAGSWGRLAAILDRLQRLPAAAAAFRRAIGRAEESLAIGGNEAQLRSRLADYHRQLTEVNRRLSNTAPTLSLDTTRGMQPTAEPEFIP
ncbi:MAG: hypothetical protein U0794_22230, partial [Isosphaeraceae bacterium]